MNHYDDTNRGTFQNETMAKQLVSFDGLLFKGRNGFSNVTPTDIDGFVQLDNENCFIFFELKHSGGVPHGQESALTKLADAITAGGAKSVVFIATHNTECPDTIVAKNAIVQKYYWIGKWHMAQGRTLEQVANSFIEFLNKERTP